MEITGRLHWTFLCPFNPSAIPLSVNWFIFIMNIPNHHLWVSHWRVVSVPKRHLKSFFDSFKSDSNTCRSAQDQRVRGWRPLGYWFTVTFDAAHPTFSLLWLPSLWGGGGGLRCGWCVSKGGGEWTLNDGILLILRHSGELINSHFHWDMWDMWWRMLPQW